ncbi:stage II sporulation protein M [Alkalibacillus flavidus]|uniref:Stage II sporulation protein M n=1 Tax=Alkalibacillus flavidus TaxID=546021 RepID=A0ABV2KS33_9BACI
MKYWPNALTIQIQPYLSLYVFLFVLWSIGVMFGAMMVSSLDFLQQQDLFFFVEQYFEVIQTESRQWLHDFKGSIWTHGKFITFIFLFGLSFVGLPVVWFLLFFKGVVVGFTVGFLVHQMSWQGFFLSILSVAPQNLFVVAAYLLIAASSMVFSIHVLRILFIKYQTSRTLAEATRFYIKSYAIGLVLISVGSLVEVTVSMNALTWLVDNL